MRLIVLTKDGFDSRQTKHIFIYVLFVATAHSDSLFSGKMVPKEYLKTSELVFVHKSLVCRSTKHQTEENKKNSTDWSAVEAKYLQDSHRHVELRQKYEQNLPEGFVLKVKIVFFLFTVEVVGGLLSSLLSTLLLLLFIMLLLLLLLLTLLVS